MMAEIAYKSQNKTVKIAGGLFLLSLLAPMLNWIFVLSKFIVVENAITTAHNILANESLFRIGIFNDLITSFIAVGLALTLYIILKPVNRNIALLAFVLKLTEAVLIAILALSHFIALLILNSSLSSTAAAPGQIQTFVGLFNNIRMSAAAVPMLFLGLNFPLFFYLLLKSKFVPGVLAGFGIVSYVLIFFYASITILAPQYAAIMKIQILSWAPSCLFELTIGLWLLIKGVKN